MPTQNPPGESYRECVELLASELRQIGLDCKIIKGTHVPKGWTKAREAYPRYCLLARYGRAKRTLYFHGHYDVVPSADMAQFRPYVEDGKLYGRGAADMKSGLAAMIYAVKAIKECGIKVDGSIGLTIVPDEETGGRLGSQYLVKEQLLGKDAVGMLTSEPTGGVIWNASRGAISLNVVVKGKPAHVGLHFDGVNAFERMLVVADAMTKIKKHVESRKTEFTIRPEAARRSILLIGGKCEGGTSFNLVPGQCSFTIDRRTNPEENLETEKRLLLMELHRMRSKGIDLEVETLQEARPAAASERDPLAEALARSVKEISGKPATFEMCPGVLETRFYTQRGIPAFAYGPGSLQSSHGPNEFVRVNDVYRCAAVYALTALSMLSAGTHRWDESVGHNLEVSEG